MKVLKRCQQHGNPIEVELTDAEMVISEIHSNLMDTGLNQGDAMIVLRGKATATALQPEGQFIDTILTPEFVDYLCDH
jgi:hypothetical protein